MNELWRNQQEIMQGLGAAEFNLRAHQKVLNAIALELNDVYKRLPITDPAGIDVKPQHLLQIDVPQEDGTTLPRINWPLYHKMIEEETKAAQAAEKAAKEAAAQAAQELAAKTAEEAAKPAEVAPAPSDAPVPVEPGTVGAKEEDGGPEFPEGATIF